MSEFPQFPQPRTVNGRLFWVRSELESYKGRLLGKPFEPGPDFIEQLVPSAQVTKEFGFGRRTLGRRIASAPVASKLRPFEQ